MGYEGLWVNRSMGYKGGPTVYDIRTVSYRLPYDRPLDICSIIQNPARFLSVRIQKLVNVKWIFHKSGVKPSLGGLDLDVL